MLKTLDNALHILDCFNQKPAWGVRELSKETGINYTTIFKTLSTFKAHGFLIQNLEGGKYELGYKFLEYYSSLTDRIMQVDELSNIMNKISDKSNETVFLNVIEDNNTVCVKISESFNSYVKLVIKLGSRLPMHLGSRGKVILAFLPNESRDKILDTLFKKVSDIDRSEFENELLEIRAKGWSCTIGERFPNVVGVSIPLFNQKEEVFASLTIGFPDKNFKEEQIDNFISILKTYQNTIEKLISIQEISI